MTEEQSVLDNHLCFAIYASSREMIKLYHPLLKQLDLTYPQYLVLIVLWQRKQLSVKELGQELFLDSGTLTPLLKRLEDRGVVTRERSKQDERVVFVRLTDKGEQLEAEAKDIPLRIFEKTGLSEQSFLSLNKDLRQLLKGLTE